jgi:hypothetical protein
MCKAFKFEAIINYCETLITLQSGQAQLETSAESGEVKAPDSPFG